MEFSYYIGCKGAREDFSLLKNKIDMTKHQINNIAYGIVGCAIEVHRQFGPGLLESVYQECLKAELIKRGFDLKIEHHVPLFVN